MIQSYKDKYRWASRAGKDEIIDEVVQEWRNQNPPGRFLAKKRLDNGEVFWYDVGDETAKRRTAKSLAEWTPALKTKKRPASEAYQGKIWHI